MNVILIAIGSSGDVHPFVGLGRALQARGHRVTLVTNGYFEPLARQAGFEFEPLGTAEDYLAVLRDPAVWHPAKGFPIVIEWGVLKPLRAIYELLESRYVPGETVVAAPLLAFGARIAQEKLGIPLVSITLQPAMFRGLSRVSKLPSLPVSNRMPKLWNQWLYWLIDVGVIDRLIAPETNAFRAELGLPPARRFFHDWWFSPDRIVGLFPDWYAPPPDDWPAQLRLTGFPLYDESESTPVAPEVEEFLAEGEPPVVFTPGSGMRHGKEFFEAAADACRRLGRRAALVTRFHDQVPARLPEGIRAFDFVPFSRLFPRSAAVVHHGGIGTSAQGLAAGVPQLLMPMAYDQLDNAARLERLGVSRTIPPRRFKGSAVADALHRILNAPDLSLRCREIAGRLRDANPLPETCRLIEQAAERHPNSLVRS